MNGRDEELLPGIAESVTVINIAPKLSWTAVHILASVSRTWQRAIQSRKVYDERICAKATETLVVVKRRDDDLDELVASLYSAREKTLYRLPRIPPSLGRISLRSEFLTSNGSLYVLRPGCNSNYCSACTSLQTESTLFSGLCTSFGDANRIIVLDLAGQGQWEEGDINQAIQGPQQSLGPTCHIMCGCLVLEYFFSRRRLTLGCTRGVKSSSNPVEHPWRMVPWSQELALEEHLQRWFAEGGKGYAQRALGNHHHMLPLTRHVLSISSEIEPAILSLLNVLAVNNEFIAIAHWRDDRINPCIIQSRGFGSASTEIVWETVPHSTSFTTTDFSMCPIQL